MSSHHQLLHRDIEQGVRRRVWRELAGIADWRKSLLGRPQGGQTDVYYSTSCSFVGWTEADGMNSDIQREHDRDVSKTLQAVLATPGNAASTYSPTLRSARNQK